MKHIPVLTELQGVPVLSVTCPVFSPQACPRHLALQSPLQHLHSAARDAPAHLLQLPEPPVGLGLPRLRPLGMATRCQVGPSLLQGHRDGPNPA